MRLAVDASNIRAGGGLTHLVELFRAADPLAGGFEKVIVWASKATLERMADRPWLTKRSAPILEGHYLARAFWQRYRLGALARVDGADLLFVPGGSFAGDFRPVVTMSRNLLPFEWGELSRFGISLTTLKLLLLRWSQSRSFRQADATIFLTRFAQDAVTKVTGPLQDRTAIIPHGIDHRFFAKPRAQANISGYTSAAPFRIIYVSIVDAYKHQWRVAEAVARLAREGMPVRLDLYGPARASALRRLNGALQRFDPEGKVVRYWGPVRHDELHARYAQVDLFVFASSCENMPNILLEGMAAGLPIACSDRGPMPEVLGAQGTYFDPEDAESIAVALRRLIEAPALRARNAESAFETAQQYSWTRCADETFTFLARLAQRFTGQAALNHLAR